GDSTTIRRHRSGRCEASRCPDHDGMVQLAVDHKDAAKAIDRGQDHTQREGRVAPTQRRRVATGLIVPAAQPEARAFVRQLARHGVPYYWDSRVTEPAGIPYHTWTYWRDSAHDALIRLS